MAEHSGFFNGVEYDAADWKNYFEDIVETGVLDKTASNLQVRAGSGMNIVVTAGKAWLRGYGYYNDSDKTIKLQTANGTYPRIDTVVTRYDESPPLASPKIETIVVTGTPASAPVAPSIVRNSTTYDLKLAEITVKKGVTSISQADIGDTRFDASVCGIVKSPASRIDTTNLFAQYDAEFQTFKNQMQSEDIASSLQAQINGRSNPNLLINSDFRVHQRGDNFTGLYDAGKGKYTADRWIVYCSSTYNSYLSVSCADTGGLRISNSRTTSCVCTLRYYVEDADLYAIRGRKICITYSIDGAKTYELKTISAAQTTRLLIGKSLTIPASSTLTVNYVKAELVDSGATVAAQAATPYTPRPYAQEYHDCQRYYQYTDNVTLYQTHYDGMNGVAFRYYLPNKMRIAPTVSRTGANLYNALTSAAIVDKSISLINATTDYVEWRGNGMTSNGLIVLRGQSYDAEIYS